MDTYWFTTIGEPPSLPSPAKLDTHLKRALMQPLHELVDATRAQIFKRRPKFNRAGAPRHLGRSMPSRFSPYSMYEPDACRAATRAGRSRHNTTPLSYGVLSVL